MNVVVTSSKSTFDPYRMERPLTVITTRSCPWRKGRKRERSADPEGSAGHRYVRGRALFRLDAFCARSLRSLPDGEADALPFTQVVEPGTDAGRLVEEIFRPVGCRDEPEALVGDSLDCSARRRHRRVLSVDEPGSDPHSCLDRTHRAGTESGPVEIAHC